MKILTLLLFAVLIYPISVDGAKILAIVTVPMYSHYVMFEKLLIALAQKGHYVDVVSHFPQENPVPGLHDLSMKGSTPVLQNNLSLTHVGSISSTLEQTVIFQAKENGLDTCEAAFKTKVLQDLKRTTKKYDLLITSIFGSDCMLGFGNLFKIPVISMSSIANMAWAADRIGNPDNPSYILSFFMQHRNTMDLWDRMKNTFLLLKAKILYEFISARPSNALAKEFFGPEMPDLEQLILNTSLIFVNSHFSTNQAKPLVPNYIEVGGLHIETPKQLPKHLDEIVKNSKKGVIYFSFGSMVRTETIPIEKLKGFLEGFAKFPEYTILWKGPKEKLPKELHIPGNVYFQNWMPQVDVLCDSKTKLFISHGGNGGIQEAIYCGVPVIGVSLFCDQVNNILKVQEMGMGMKLCYRNISKASVSEALSNMFSNTSYAINAKRISQLFKDRPLTPLETAIYWTEYVIRHKGAPQLRTLGADLPWYQYLLIDVALVVSFVIFIACYVVVKTVKFLFCKNKSGKIVEKQKRH